MSPSERRVRTALSFGTPDRVPRYDAFWPEFVDGWRQAKQMGAGVSPEDWYGIDLTVAAADETPWPSSAVAVRANGGVAVSRDGWGRTARTRTGAQFSQTLSVALPEASSDLPAFESPRLPGRYTQFLAQVEREHPRRAVFAKTGGPFLRSANLRGEEQWLMDLAGDETRARDLAAQVTAHITEVGVESLRRGGALLSGIWIYDDIGANAGPMISPRTFERVFQRLLAEMVSAYKAAGASFVVFHSDGNILPLLDMIVDAGVDAVQPVEPKAGMDILALRRRYGDRLALIGGLDNAHVLPSGDRARIEADLERVLAAGREGGLVVGSHSIGPDVPVAAYDYLIELEDARGRYPLQ